MIIFFIGIGIVHTLVSFILAIKDTKDNTIGLGVLSKGLHFLKDLGVRLFKIKEIKNG